MTDFRWLAQQHSTFAVDFGSMMVFMILSLGGFGFYRLYFGVMLIRFGDTFLMVKSCLHDWSKSSNTEVLLTERYYVMSFLEPYGSHLAY